MTMADEMLNESHDGVSSQPMGMCLSSSTPGQILMQERDQDTERRPATQHTLSADSRLKFRREPNLAKNCVKKSSHVFVY